MRAFYEVQVVNRESGAERWVRVEAEGRDAARESVVRLGEMVGEVRLAEVIASPAASSTIPGVVVCPECKGTTWVGGRGVLVWLGVILLFPIGLLLLFIRPTYSCAACGFQIRTHQRPVDVDGRPGGLTVVQLVLLVLALAMLATFGVLVLFSRFP